MTRKRIAGERGSAYRFEIDGVWMNRSELAKRLNVYPHQISMWINNKSFEYHIEKLLGYVPRYSQNSNDWQNNKGFRWYIVYETDTDYRFGIDVGYGHTEKMAVSDFLKSRKRSVLKFKILMITPDVKKAQAYILTLVNSLIHVKERLRQTNE